MYFQGAQQQFIDQSKSTIPEPFHHIAFTKLLHPLKKKKGDRSRPQYNARQTVTTKLCLFILSLALGWPHYQHILVSLSHQHICLPSLPLPRGTRLLSSTKRTDTASF